MVLTIPYMVKFDLCTHSVPAFAFHNQAPAKFIYKSFILTYIKSFCHNAKYYDYMYVLVYYT